MYLGCVDLAGFKGVLGEDGDLVVCYLGKSRIDIQARGIGAAFELEDAYSQSAQKGGAATKYADLAVVRGNGRGRHLGIENGALGRQDCACKGFVGHDESACRLVLEFFGFLSRFFDRTDVHKCLLGQMVPFAFTQFLERTDRVFK